MGPKRFLSQNSSLFIAKFKKLGFSNSLKTIPASAQDKVSNYQRTSKAENS